MSRLSTALCGNQKKRSVCSKLDGLEKPREGGIKVIGVIQDTFREVRSAPTGIVRILLANARDLLHRECKPTSKISIHILPGMGEIPWFYAPTREAVTKAFPGIRVLLPHRMLFHVSQIENYLMEVSLLLGPQTILIGHSMGGLAALVAATRYRRSVIHAILGGTPTSLQDIHPIAEFPMRYVLGIDLQEHPGVLRKIRHDLLTPALKERLTVLASANDGFVPPGACRIPGVRFELLKKPTHVNLLNDPEALEALIRIIGEIIKRAEQPERIRHYAT